LKIFKKNGSGKVLEIYLKQGSKNFFYDIPNRHSKNSVFGKKDKFDKNMDNLLKSRKFIKSSGREENLAP
jgi:hypothetical protein